MKSESLLKVIELLSIQQIDTRKINVNTEKFIIVKKTGKCKKNNLNHQQDYRITLSHSFETLPIEECQDKPEPNDEDSSVLPCLNHYILPTLHEDHPDVALLHIDSNDINNQIKDKTNTEKLTEEITNIGESCIDLGVKKVIISSILPPNNIALQRLIRHVNYNLREQCVLNEFGFISNDSQEHIYGKMGNS